MGLYLSIAMLAMSMLYVAGRSLRQGPGGDATTFYFGTRLLFRGDNPYDLSAIHAEWQKSRLVGNTQAAPTPFVNPPVMGLLMAPIAVFPFKAAMLAFALLNLACLFGSVALLDRMFMTGSSTVARLLLATWVVLMPPVMKLLSYGQSALFICALTALALYFLKRRNDLWAGFFLALTFAKFTITVPLLAILLLRGRWKAAIASVTIFGALNLALILPLGITQFIQSYRGAIAKVDGVNGWNDPLSTLAGEPYLIVSSKRFFFLLFGTDRAAVSLAGWLFAALVVAVFLLLLRRRRLPPAASEDPLELGMAIMVGMTLMYHRVYDLAALMFVIYPLAQYHRKNPAAHPGLWMATMATVFALSFLVVGTGWSKPFDLVLSRLHLPASPNFGSVFVIAVLAELMIMSALDLRRPGGSLALGAGNESVRA